MNLSSIIHMPVSCSPLRDPDCVTVRFESLVHIQVGETMSIVFPGHWHWHITCAETIGRPEPITMDRNVKASSPDIVCLTALLMAIYRCKYSVIILTPVNHSFKFILLALVLLVVVVLLYW